MIEQYLYSRASADKINSKGQTVKTGFGCIARSDGLSGEDIKKLEIYASDYDTQVADSSGNPVASVMKYQIDNQTSDTVISKSSRISQSERKAHICHQILFRGEVKDEIIRDPKAMFRLNFISRDVDDEDITFDSADEISSVLMDEEKNAVNTNLSETLAYFNLSAESFRLLVSAVFDCRMINRKIIILTDYQEDDAYYKSASLLYHIFRFLPYQIRAAAGFDTCYSRNSEKSSIDICFASRATIKKVSSTVYKIGEKNCMYDYVLDLGEIIHTKTDTQPEFFDSHGILFENLSKIIKAESETGECQDEKLTAIFELLSAFFKSDNEKLYAELPLYDTAFIADSVLREKKIGRVHAEKLISDFIKYREDLGGDANEKWSKAIEKYFASFEVGHSDSQIIEWLTKLYFLTSELKEYSLDTLTEKMLDDIKSEGIEEISRYTDEIISHGIPDASSLLNKLYKNDRNLALSYISYYLDGHPTTEAIINSAPMFYRDFIDTIPDCEKTLYIVFVRRFKAFHVTPRDAVVLSEKLTHENSPFIDEFYNKALDYVFANIKFEKEDTKWFGDLKYIERMKLTSEYSYLVYAVKYILNSYKKSEGGQDQNTLSFTDMHIKFAGSYIKKDQADEFIPRFHEFDPKLRDIIYGMYTDFRISLTSHDDRLLYDSSYTDGQCDYSKLCAVLSMYPTNITAYILFVSGIVEASDEFGEFLSALEKAMKVTSHQEYAMDIIKSVKLLREDPKYQNSDGTPKEYFEKFMSDMYDWYLKAQNPIKKVALAAAKKIILS